MAHSEEIHGVFCLSTCPVGRRISWGLPGWTVIKAYGSIFNWPRKSATVQILSRQCKFKLTDTFILGLIQTIENCEFSSQWFAFVELYLKALLLVCWRSLLEVAHGVCCSYWMDIIKDLLSISDSILLMRVHEKKILSNLSVRNV